MIKKESKKRRLYLCWLSVSVLAIVFVAPALAQEEPNDPVLPDPNMLEGPRLPGTVESTGTYFEVTDSNYLNITFESSESVHLRLESVPEMVVMDINTADGATSTEITLTGFAPSTTFYKYEDDYHNEVIFTTDDNGSYTFAQDLSQPHLVFIQPNAGTYFLAPGQGKIPPIGTWDASTRTFTLNPDVDQTIQIDEDNLTLVGVGHTITGSGSGYGVYLYRRTGVTVKNVNVQGFYTGIYLRYSSYNTLTDNTASNNGSGIILTSSSNNNTLTDNSANSNNLFGIYLAGSVGNILSGNTMSGNHYNFVLHGYYSDSYYDNDIDTTNTVDGKPIYYVKNAVGQVYDASTNAGVFYAINCEGITIKDLTLTKSLAGVFLWKTYNATIENVSASNNSSSGIELWYSSGNTLTGNTASNNGSGIYLYSSSGNTLINNTASNNAHAIRLLYSSSNILTGNTTNSNNTYGIWLEDSEYNTLTRNTASNNYYGIYLRYSSSNNTLTDNTASNNEHSGIYLSGSGGSTLSGNTMSGNHYNFVLHGNSDSDFDNDIDTTNTVDGKPIYYVKNAVNQVYDSSTNAGTFYAINCDNITIKDLTVTNNMSGVHLWNTHNSRIENVTASNNGTGIKLVGSSNNTLTGNTASNNSQGIHLGHSSYNTLTGNTASNNHIGIDLYSSNNNSLIENTVSNNRYGIVFGVWCSNNIVRGNTISSNTAFGLQLYYDRSDNQIYNNNFIDNAVQAYDYGGTDNVFNLDKPIGGNYWSDWTSPDSDGDGFVDYPYIFAGGQDNLPLTRPFTILVIEIDIKPGSYPNAINLGSYGLVPVAILSSDQFDATTVDPDTAELAGAGVAVRGKSNKFMAHEEDVNGDGLIDLLLQVATLNLDPGGFQDGYAVLTGTTYDGSVIEGSDEITIVPPVP